MSHSKHTKRGYSLYLEKWNSSAKKYINTCAICGHKGYSPVIEKEDFCNNSENKGNTAQLLLSGCVSKFSGRLYKFDAGILAYFKENFCKI